jgi:xanthine dehydrogenase accessory factor
MMDMFEEILACLRTDERMALATIISNSGSTPVPPGAKMLMREGGAIPLGTVGGGCIEADVQEASRQLLVSGRRCLVRRFTLTEDQIESGMLCGGSLDILIETLTEQDTALYATLCSRREAGIDMAVVTLIAHGPIVRGKFLISPSLQPSDEDDMRALLKLAPDLPDSFRKTVCDAIDGEAVIRVPFPGGECVVEPVAHLRDLIIFGGGHVSRYLSRSAAMAGFRVTVVDDRAEYANAQRFPEAHRILALDFDAAWGRLVIRPSTSIVIITRGHKFDERVLEHAVQTPARYIGMIGSKRKVLATFAELVGRGVSPDLLRDIHAPIGLAIGAVKAEEIAISITAELIAARRGVLTSVLTMSERVRDISRPESPLQVEG